ncbi:uncharacterized protein LOC133202807 [Saccostrea echinata]|uniref:uncharacterized protein LOC133202807 n=1 Tax=Saccostrea echinata TaxID=191078 RepID=UPI002A81F630|nr:uncharacterized protein LOC133202807 [Saccostrea echinata]
MPKMQLPTAFQKVFEMFGIFCLYFGIFSAVNALPDFQDGDIRLIGGRTENEGTVVIYHDGRWGSICDRGWDIRDGNVACHQLGFHRALQSLRRSPFGPGRTLRWLTALRCGGRELRLDKCRPRRWGIDRDERHCQQYSRSAAVVCMPKTITSTSSTTTTTAKTTTKSHTTSTTVRPSTKQITATAKPTTIAPKTSSVENNIPTVKTIIAAEDIDGGDEEKHTISERYSNRSIIYAENNGSDNFIPNQIVTNKRRSRMQYDAEWSDTRRTKDIENSPTTKKPTTTTKKPSTTTKKPSTTPAAPAPFRYEAEVYSINLPRRRWVKDPLLKCWVLATVRGKILIAKPGRRPKRITKEEYYKRRRTELEAQRGVEDVSNEITRSPLNDASKTHGNVENNRIADHVSRKTTRSPTTTTSKPTTTEKPTTTTTTKEPPPARARPTPKPSTLKSTTRKSTTTTTITPKRTTPKPTPPKPTTPKPTTPKPTTPKPTTPKPTTPKPTTPKPTTPKPTTLKSTTTTTPKPIPFSNPNPEPSSANTYEDEVYALKLVKSKWIKDNDLGLWVMLSRSGKVLIAKPGQRSKKVTKDEYYQMRREKIRETHSHDRMKSDDPLPGQELEQVPAPTRRQLPLGSEENTISGNASTLFVSSNVIIGSDLNITGRSSHNGKPRKHDSRIENRHRHGHGSGKIKIRLAGQRANRGKIEILPSGREEWGVICGDHWTMRETMVVCRGLNLGYGQQPLTTAVYGGSDQKKYYTRVRCKGNEKRLADCEWMDHEGAVQCSSRESVAGVICTSALPDLEPSIYMLETTTFLQDRHLYYLQCAMEEKCLAPSAYEAQRSRYWRQSTRRLLRFSSVVKNIGTADFKPMTDRSQWEWHACHMHYHSMDVFAHYDIMDQNGNRVAEGLKASFCLEDSACNPGIFPKYSCQNYGQQGISVGCSDNYMADIDCQWVDITDLEPGEYIFKVEVNPKMLVAEINFDNNAVICNLQYTGYYARLSKCKLASLL